MPDWADVQVGEVWMPWTEDPADPAARDIRNRQSATAHRLRLGLEARGVAGDDLALALAVNALTNAAAMRTLHHGFSQCHVRRFLSSDDSQHVRTPKALPGVRVHVLGPSRNPEVIRDMDPPANESYLWLAATEVGDGIAAPFSPDWRISVESYAAEFAELPKRDRDLVAKHSSLDPLSIAVRLEAAVNGTSLVLAFEIGDAVLLFPGDAQWGTWHQLLTDPATMELLQRTTFLKVGHHGSHNATPVGFVDAVRDARAALQSPPDAWAMVSTRQTNIWKEIPKPPLLGALREVTGRLARSDETGGPRPRGFTSWDDAVVEALVPIG
jgi:hypothetical protein